MMSRLVLLISAICTLAIPNVATAAELIAGRIEHAGGVVLESSFEVSDSADAGTVWLALGGSRFREVEPVPRGGATSERLKLDGEVRVIADRGNRGWLVAELRGLELVRSEGTGDAWELPRKDVLRTAAAAGADLPFWYRMPRALLVAALAALTLFAMALLAWFLRPKSRHPAAPTR